MPEVKFDADDLALAQAIELAIPFGTSFESIVTALEFVLARQIIGANASRDPWGNEVAVQIIQRHMRAFLAFGDMLLTPIAQMVPTDG